ncbi:MAG: helix-turn-helix domain-containing protein [Chloroflexi bacterium]|nr:helix-turn-helix domain-containing protein [Chloroflexota bacterium]
MRKARSSDWLSIRQASQLLGVHISTVREWTNAGTVPSYRTPGGHRRYLKSDLDKFLDQQRVSAQNSPSQTEQVLSRLRQDLRAHPHADWLQVKSTSSEQDRVKQREFGQHLLACVVGFVEQPDQHDRFLDEGRRTAREYGRMLMTSGVSAGNAARATIHFRQLILKTVLEVSLGSRTGDEEDARLFQRVSAFLDQLLLAIIEAYP